MKVVFETSCGVFPYINPSIPYNFAYVAIIFNTVCTSVLSTCSSLAWKWLETGIDMQSFWNGKGMQIWSWSVLLPSITADRYFSIPSVFLHSLWVCFCAWDKAQEVVWTLVWNVLPFSVLVSALFLYYVKCLLDKKHMNWGWGTI